MRKIYTSIDIGSDNIKLVVAEIINTDLHILSAISLPSEGIKKGLITDAAKTMVSIKSAIDKTENVLGIKINKVIASVPSNNASYSLVEGKINIDKEDNIIVSNSIVRVLENAIKNKIDEEHELVNILPINFSTDKTEDIIDPKGMNSNILGVKAIMVTVPKINVYSVISILEGLGIKVIEITFNSIADYYANKLEEDKKICGIINIGGEKTEVSVFNKGILMNSAIINEGGNILEKEIARRFNINIREAKKLKEKFANFHKRFAKVTEKIEVINNDGEKIKINQYEISETCMTKIMILIKNAKNALKDLTNKEINSIIITGGTSEGTGFDTLIGEISSKRSRISHINNIGARKNRYSSCIGMILYFNEKLEFRNKKYSTIDETNQNELISTNKKITQNNSSLINKVFGYFFDN